jgi:hypothetical protein
VILSFSTPHRVAAILLLAGSLAMPTRVQAQELEPAEPAELAKSHLVTDTATFLAGAAAAFAIHESGHLAFDALFDARPRLVPVRFGAIPFFAITPTRPLSPRRLFVVASAGLWTQEISSEWLLPKHRDLRHEHAPFAKGMLAFDVLTSIGYASVAFAGAGPSQRDTRGIAQGAQVSERAIGAIVLAPAVLEAYRYFRPDAVWARWAMRAVEAGSVLLIFKQ